MPLDPAAQAIIDRVRAAGIPPWHVQAVPDARRVYQERIRLLDARPIAVARITDLTIPGGDGPMLARAYHPQPGTSLPVLLYLHGGGWVLGSRDSHDWVCRELATVAGCLVVSLEYRLAPEHRHPAQLEDVHAAMRWLAREAGTLGGDGERLAVGGDSAGGHLSAAVSLLARDRGGPSLVGQVLIYPVTAPDFETPSYYANAEGYLLSRADMLWFWDHYLGGQEAGGYAVPLTFPNLRGLPPAMVITAEFDPLHDEGVAYATRLAEASVPVVRIDEPGMIHGFVALPDGLPQGRRVVRDIGAWLGARFAGVPA